MICKYCNSDVPSISTFCPNCGQNLMPSQQSYANHQPQKKKNCSPAVRSTKFSYIVMLFLVGAATFIAVILCYKLFFCGYKSTLSSYVRAINDANGAGYVSLMPDYVINSYPNSKEDTIISYTDSLKHFLNSYNDELGKIRNISYEIIRTDELSNKEINDYVKQIKDDYNEKIVITEAYDIHVKLVIEGEIDSNITRTVVRVIKIENRWYVTK